MIPEAESEKVSDNLTRILSIIVALLSVEWVGSDLLGIKNFR